MAMPTSQPDADALFAEIAVSCGFMTDVQVQLCREAAGEERAHGHRRKTLAQVAFERKYLSSQQIENIEQVIMDRGARPLLGGLELLERIGGGGMGTVYKARQVGLDRIVAVKVLKPDLAADAEFIARFQREARLAAQVWHPKAIQVFDVGFDLGRHYMVMEYVDGVPLSEMLHRRPVDVRWALQVIRDVAEPLGKAHSLGIIHRDIKPGNVLIGRDGTARLSDLGLAKSTLGGDELTLTHTGHTAGTPYYMSPEQCRGDREPDQRTDIYSLGVTLFFMVCGKLPFDGPTPFVVMHKHVSEPLPEPLSVNPSLPEPVAGLIRDMTAKERDDRTQTCEEVLQRIAAILAGLPSGAGMHEAATVKLGAAQQAGSPEIEAPAAGRAATAVGQPGFTSASQARRPRRRTAWIAALAAAVVICTASGWLVLRSKATHGPGAAEQSSGAAGIAAHPGQAVADVPPGQRTSGTATAPPIPASSGALRVPPGFRAVEGTTAEPYSSTGWAKEILHEAMGIEMVFVPAGEFLMGSLWSEGGRKDDEGPQHRVRITRPFYMGKCEVTLGQWRSGPGPSEHASGGGNRFPALDLTWNECQEFIANLNARKPGGTFRLPTEAEWEYACRAGTTTPFSFGETVTTDQVNFNGNLPYTGEPNGVYKGPVEVGSYPPNPWGLYDMHGNVAEFCQDWSDVGYYGKSPTDDPQGPETGTGRVVRGGQHDAPASDCRSAFRHVVGPAFPFQGLRLALTLP